MFITGTNTVVVRTVFYGIVPIIMYTEMVQNRASESVSGIMAQRDYATLALQAQGIYTRGFREAHNIFVLAFPSPACWPFGSA